MGPGGEVYLAGPAVAAASALLAQQVSAGQRSAGIDDAIEDVARRLN